MAATGQISDTRVDRSPEAGAGWILFAAIAMIVGGCFAIIEGLGAVLRHGSFDHAVSNYPFGGSITVWGWTVLIAGPVWAIMIIAIDFFVIWALAAHGKALAEK